MDPNAAGAPAPDRRRLWFILWAAFTLAPVIYGIVGAQVAAGLPPTPSEPMLRKVFMVLAPLALLAGALLHLRAPRARAGVAGFAAFFGGEEPAPPEAFQMAFINATSLVESCAVLGFVLVFLGAPVTEYLPYGAGTLAVMLAVALPTGLRYWSERAGAGGSSPIA